MHEQFDSVLIGKRLAEIRITLKLTKRAFSEIVGMDNGQYGKIEYGKGSLTLKQTFEICSRFAVSANWLILGKGEPGNSRA